MTIGERIKLGLKARGIPATSLAEQLGFSRQNLQRYLSDEIHESKHWTAIAAALGCSVEWLTTGNGAAPEWAKPKTLADAIAIIQADAEARAKEEGTDKREALVRIVLENLGIKSSDEDLSKRIERQKSAIEELTAMFESEKKARAEAERTLADRSAPRPHQRAG